MNARIRALGETVLRVKDLETVKRFYTDVIGLDVLREFDGISFLKVSDGHGGHTQIVDLFHESLPVPFPKAPREPVRLESTSQRRVESPPALGRRSHHVRASLVSLALPIRPRPRGQHPRVRVL